MTLFDRERRHLFAPLNKRLLMFREVFVNGILRVGRLAPSMARFNCLPAPLRLKHAGKFLKIVSRPLMADHSIKHIG
jgi:hypothetical protein